jgi:hypothetical protein
MAIPLVGSSPLPSGAKDLVSGDSATFVTGVGSWAAFGAASVVRDTVHYFSQGTVGALDVTCTSDVLQGAQLALPAASTGYDYFAAVALKADVRHPLGSAGEYVQVELGLARLSRTTDGSTRRSTQQASGFLWVCGGAHPPHVRHRRFASAIWPTPVGHGLCTSTSQR